MLVQIIKSPVLMTWANLTIRLGGVALLLPLVLVSLSDAEIVLWYTYTAITALLVMFDFGFSPTLSRFMSYACGEAASTKEARFGITSNPDPASHSISIQSVRLLCKRAYIYLVMAAAAIGLTMGLWVLARPIENAGLNGFLGWSLACWVMCSSLAQLYGMRFGAELTGFNEIALVQRINLITSLGSLLSGACALALGGGVVGLVTVYYAWNFGTLLFLFLGARSRFHSFSEERLKQEKIEALWRDVWPAAWRSGLGIALSAGVLNLSGIVYAQLVAPSAAASYMLVLQIARAIASFSNAPFYTRLPTLAGLYVNQKYDDLIRYAYRGMRTAYVVFLIGFLGATFLIELVLVWLDSAVKFIDRDVWFAMGGAFLLERYGAMHLQLYSLSNHIIWHISNGVTGVLLLVLSFLLYPLVGIIAFPISMILAHLFFYTWYSVCHSYREFSLSFWHHERRCFIPALIFFLFVSAFFL